MDDLLTIKDLKLNLMSTRGIVYALNDVNLSIRPGEIHGLVGESGCGKSILALSVEVSHRDMKHLIFLTRISEM